MRAFRHLSDTLINDYATVPLQTGKKKAIPWGEWLKTGRMRVQLFNYDKLLRASFHS